MLFYPLKHKEEKNRNNPLKLVEITLVLLRDAACPEG